MNLPFVLLTLLFKSCLFRPFVQCARRAQKCFQMLSSRKSIFESFVKTAPICCHFSNLCISFYNLWDTFFDFLLSVDSYLHLLIRFALFSDMCPLICEDALSESQLCHLIPEKCCLFRFSRKHCLFRCLSRKHCLFHVVLECSLFISFS